MCGTEDRESLSRLRVPPHLENPFSVYIHLELLYTDSSHLALLAFDEFSHTISNVFELLSPRPTVTNSSPFSVCFFRSDMISFTRWSHAVNGLLAHD